ncbi:transglutaminase family protein [Desulfatiferula olefinivorans]
MREPEEFLYDRYLMPTFFVDSDSPDIIDYATAVCTGLMDDRQKAIALFYAIRDDIRYDLFGFEVNLNYMKAGYILKKQSGYCVSKALVLAAASRVVGIPSRLGFADVINHQNPGKLHELMRTNIFAYHGFAELFIEGRWVKATPSLDSDLCEKMGYITPEFDGIRDTVYPAVNRKGERHMEYVSFYGSYPDLPILDLVASVETYYPHFFGGKSISVRALAASQGLRYEDVVRYADMTPVPHESPREEYSFRKAG